MESKKKEKEKKANIIKEIRSQSQKNMETKA